MAMDPMSIMRAARPSLDPESMRAAQQSIPTPTGSRSVDDLATTPASPGYRSKMPPPPCFKCGEDHQPNRRYDHPYMQEPHVISADPQVHEMIDRVRAEGAAEYGNAPPRMVVTEMAPATPLRRVAVYVGRNDMYVVSVETSPDWDAEETFKVPEDRVLGLVKLARALGVKVQDKTGGDLVALEELDAGKPS